MTVSMTINNNNNNNNNNNKPYSCVVVRGSPLGICFIPVHLTINLLPNGVQSQVFSRGQC